MADKKYNANPLVSIVMPAYNSEQYIERAITSVINQSVNDWELLVIDDGSKDHTCQIVKQMAMEDSRIRLYCNESNMGVAKTRNRALDMSRGAYVAFLDSDDMWYPQKLENQIRALEGKKADLAYASYRLVTPMEGGSCVDYIVPESVDLKSMLSQNYIGCSTVMMTRALADNFRFSTECYHEDYALWLQMLRQGVKMVGSREIMVDYTYYPTSKAGNKIRSAKNRWNIYRNHLGLSVWESLAYFAQYAVAGVNKYRKLER